LSRHKAENSDTILHLFVCFLPNSRRLGGKQELTLRQQDFFTDQQVAECGQQAQSIDVFRQSAITDLAIAYHLLDIAERMFHFRADAGFAFLSFQLVSIQRFSYTGSFGDEPGNVLSKRP